MRLTNVLTGCLALTLAGLVSTGCSRKLAPEKPGTIHKPGDIVARVNGQKIIWQDLEHRAQHALREEVASKKLFVPKDREEEACQFFRRQVVQMFVNKTVLLAEARRRGIQVTADDRKTTLQQIEPLLKSRGYQSFDDFLAKSPLGEKTMRRDFEDGLYVDKLIGQEIRSKITVTDSERDKLAQEIATDRHTAKRRADDVRLQLVHGTTDFATLAKQNTDMQICGDLGELTRGRLDKPIDDLVFNQKVNEIGPVIEVPAGYDIIKVTSRTAAKPAAGTTPAVGEILHATHILFKAPPMLTGKSIDNVIRGRKYDEGLKQLLQNLRSKAKIETIYADMVF